VIPPELVRCEWAGSDPVYLAYHDQEWGVPEFDDQRLFEMLILEGAQAGLSWITILRKREAYRQAFEGFNPEQVAAFDDARIDLLLLNPGIVRNKLKIRATVGNAQGFLRIQEEFGSFAKFAWDFVGGKPRHNQWHSLSEISAQTEESLALSKDLRRRGFRFIGPTIMYAFMQAVGMVNDHIVTCFRYSELSDQN
jgi:DNA-3-methyladenine glycosylase I